MPSALPSPRVLVAVGILALVCTAVAFLLFFALIGVLGSFLATRRGPRAAPVQDVALRDAAAG
jgi:hypothetical protein